MVDFPFFKLAAVRHLGCLKVGNFNFGPRSETQYASSCQILRTSFEPLWRNSRFSIFKMAAAAIWDFESFKFLTVGTHARWSNCVCVPNFVEIARTAAEIWRFFDFSRWRPSAILDCQKLEISTSGPVRRHNMRHRAKFREDRSNRSRDMADFRFINF